MEKEIYDPQMAKYANDVSVFVANSNNGSLELHQTQQMQTEDRNDVYNALRSGLDLIMNIHLKSFIEDKRDFKSVILTRAAIDPANVIRVAYVDPDRVEIQDGKIQSVMITYGVIQLPDSIGFDISTEQSLADLFGKEQT